MKLPAIGYGMTLDDVQLIFKDVLKDYIYEKWKKGRLRVSWAVPSEWRKTIKTEDPSEIPIRRLKTDCKDALCKSTTDRGHLTLCLRFYTNGEMDEVWADYQF